MAVDVVCVVCGKIVTLTPTRAKNRVTCSRDCYRVYTTNKEKYRYAALAEEVYDEEEDADYVSVVSITTDPNDSGWYLLTAAILGYNVLEKREREITRKPARAICTCATCGRRLEGSEKCTCG